MRYVFSRVVRERRLGAVAARAFRDRSGRNPGGKTVNPGLIGGIVGGAIGLAGGIIGTYFGIKNTNGPRERAFMVKASIVVWIALIVFFCLMIVLPNPYRFFLWIPYGILLPWGIVAGNRGQQRIRQEEMQEAERRDAP
jgi:hypothetical protein